MLDKRLDGRPCRTAVIQSGVIIQGGGYNSVALRVKQQLTVARIFSLVIEGRRCAEPRILSPRPSAILTGDSHPLQYRIRCPSLTSKYSKAVVAGTAMAVPIIQPTMYDQS